MSDFIHHGLQRLNTKIEAWLQACECKAQSVPPAFACFESSSISPALQLQTHRFVHPALQHLTWALLSEKDSGAYRAVTLYALPKAHLALPILGLDYVGLGGMMPIAALDLAPTDTFFWKNAALKVLASLESKHPDFILRKVPSFAQAVFSEKALLVATKTESGCIAMIEKAETLLDFYAQWLHSPPESDSNQAARIQNWCLAMADNKKEAGALSRLFGPAAEHYLQAYLFALPEF